MKSQAADEPRRRGRQSAPQDRVPSRGAAFASSRILAALLVVACALPSSGANRPVATSIVNRNPIMTWETTLGPGGATVPELPSLAEPEGPGGISRLRGAVFQEEGAEILFIGTAQSGEPRLSPAELLDAFAVAYRAIESGIAPAVSIDPTSDQIRRDLEEGDQMPVNYTASQGTAMGEVMLEADRLMKNLGSGRDNITHNPVTSRVPGYTNQLNMTELDHGGDYTPWTRFWIMQELDEVETCSDGAAILVRPKLMVNLKAQVPRRVVDAAGREVRVELTDADDSHAAPSARQFARHMTDHYEDPGLPLDFAREFAVYRRLLVHATLVSLAEAVRTAPDRKTDGELDLGWLLTEHVLPPFETTKTTPATIAVRQTTNGQAIHITQLRGGVNLAPKNRYRKTDRDSDELVRLVREAMAREPGRRHWQVRHRGQVYEVYAQRWQPKSLELWQVDRQVGPVRVVRVLGAQGGGPGVGAFWSLRVPRAERSAEMGTFEQLGELPRFARFSGGDGVTYILGEVGQIELPGNPPTLAYSSRKAGKRERRLLLYSNRWVYMDGEVQFVSINGGPIQWQLAPDTTVIEFSPQDPHRVERVRTAEHDEVWSWDGPRLTKIQSAAGQAIELRYSPAGQLTGLRGSDGSVTEYQYATDGFLTAVVDDKGNNVAYARRPGSGEVTGVSANFLATASAVEGRASMNLEAQPDWNQVVAITRENSNESQVFVAIRPAPAGSRERYEVVIGGEPSAAASEAIARYLDALGIEGYQAADSRPVRQVFESHPAVRTRGRVVLIGSSDVVGPLGVGLREGRQASAVLTAADPQRALVNLRRPGGSGHQFLAVEAGLSPSTRESLAEITPGNENGHVVVVAGHNCRELETRLEGMGASLAGKTVALICCGKGGEGLPGLAIRLGAKQVVSFLQPIRVELLTPVAQAVIESLRRAGGEGADLLRLLQEAIERTRNPGGAPGALPAGNLDPLRCIQLRIGRWDDSGGPNEGPRTARARWPSVRLRAGTGLTASLGMVSESPNAGKVRRLSGDGGARWKGIPACYSRPRELQG